MSPLYDFCCPLCGEVRDVWAHINETRKVHEECGRTMKRLISAPNINPDIEPYLEENISYHKPVYIKSRRHREQVLKEHGLSAR